MQEGVGTREQQQWTFHHFHTWIHVNVIFFKLEITDFSLDKE